MTQLRESQLARATSTTGIAMGQSCSQETAHWLDQLNGATERARISVAYCSAAAGQLILVKMRTSDGHAMRWQADEGTAALQYRLESGGE